MCLFCKIIAGEIPSSKVYEDDMVYAFNDINPVAPTHVLVVPKKHFDDITAMAADEEGEKYMGAVIRGISEVAKIRELGTGFRTINNCGEDGGQTVMHVHFHVIGGVKLTEKMI